MSAKWNQVGEVTDIPDLGRLSVILGDEIPVLVLRVGDDFYCVEDVCTHDGQPMTTGEFDGCELTCPRHGARFNVKTGQPTRMPATEPVRTFPVMVRDGQIFVEFDED